MYRPKFCAECNVKIVRLRWHFWTSRRFCARCAPRFLKEQVTRAVIVVSAVFLLGMAAGHAARRLPPPLVIERTQNMSSITGKESGAVPGNSSGVINANSASTATSEEIYKCGARTRKGTPCTRRVHGAVRCWQHAGLPAMLPEEQLRIPNP